MVTDRQVRMLMKLINEEKRLAATAAKAVMDEKTARKWRDDDVLPSQAKVEHSWRTRQDSFEDVWEEVQAKLKVNPGFEAKTCFEDLQRRYPGRFSDGQIQDICSGGLKHGARWKLHKKRCSSPRFIIRECCVSLTLRGWESWRLQSRDSFSIICSTILCFPTRTGKQA